MPNIEIKAKYDDLNFAHEIANKLGAKYVGKDHQIDTYFKTMTGRLKLRESSLSGGQLVPYMRPDQAGPKKSDYLVINVEDCENSKRLLSTILGVEVVVDKVREIFLIDNVRIHLDTVKGLGNFFEFEAVYQDSTAENERLEYDKVDKLMKSFLIKESNLINGSYRELSMNKT